MKILERDFLTDPDLIQDPIAYYEALRGVGPVMREPHHGVYLISGVEEIKAVYSNPEFSAIVAPLGPLVGQLPQPAPGETWNDVIEQRRNEIPLSDQFPTFDPPRHTQHRALINKLLTPSRLRENELFMWKVADELIDEFIEKQEIEFCSAYSEPFSMLVIADLLGVPVEDHDIFRDWMKGGGVADDAETSSKLFENLFPYFTDYIEKRRSNPKKDVMGELATMRFPNGDLPSVGDVVRIAQFVWAAGQETTSRLIPSGIRILCEHPNLAMKLRENTSLIPNFVDECMRYESPLKGSFRLALTDTVVGDVEIPAGSIVMAMMGAANRDQRVFENPDKFDESRHNASRNIAFGHGVHRCPGANLARVESIISFERILARMEDFRLVDAANLSYVPFLIIRGLQALPLRFRKR